ncbi:MAG TPA: cell division protein FtsL [Patescibacteria group bacterium]|nr:cell division protein FtsL [Patescibacteria group bacterium]
MLAKQQYGWDGYQETQAEPQVKPQNKIQTKPNVRLRSQCFTLIVIAVVMGMLAAVQSAAVAKAGYGLVQIKANVSRVEKENELLRLEVARLKSPQRIETIAVRQLGMVTPQKAYYAAAATTAPATAANAVNSSVITRVVNAPTLTDKLTSLLAMNGEGAATAVR